MEIDLKALAARARAKELSDVLTGKTHSRVPLWRRAFSAAGKPKPGKKPAN